MKVVYAVIGFVVGLCVHRLTSNPPVKLKTDSTHRIVGQSIPKTSSPTSAHPSILCWVPSRDGHGPVVEHIIETWGQYCDKLVITSRVKSSQHEQVQGLNFSHSSDLWHQVQHAWSFIERHYLNDFDWFVKVDDDSFFSPDNFRYMVSSKKLKASSDWIYLGHTSHHLSKPFNLGAGYAVSQAMLRRMGPYFAADGQNDHRELPGKGSSRCPNIGGWEEDVRFFDCLSTATNRKGNVTDGHDRHGREFFMAWKPADNFITVRRPDSKGWFWSNKPKWIRSGAHCCASRPVLWHQLKGREQRNWGLRYEFHQLEYFLYQVMVDPIASD